MILRSEHLRRQAFVVPIETAGFGDLDDGALLGDLDRPRLRAIHGERLVTAPAMCTTRQLKTHNTEITEAEICYQWHPWYGRRVAVTGAHTWRGRRVLFCACEAGGRVLEVPQWMCDRAACSVMRVRGGRHCRAWCARRVVSLLVQLLRADAGCRTAGRGEVDDE